MRLRLIGDYSAFGPDLVERLERAVERTAGNSRLTLVVALNYGSRAEIAAAAREAGGKGCPLARSTPARSTRRRLRRELQTAGLPELDLLIRTSGEMRLSNFLLWQAAYAELVFVDTLVARFRRGGLRRRARASLRRASGGSAADERACRPQR